jgi:hypothetical protein
MSAGRSGWLLCQLADGTCDFYQFMENWESSANSYLASLHQSRRSHALSDLTLLQNNILLLTNPLYQYDPPIFRIGEESALRNQHVIF